MLILGDLKLGEILFDLGCGKGDLSTTIEKLRIKLDNELKPGTRVISIILKLKAGKH